MSVSSSSSFEKLVAETPEPQEELVTIPAESEPVKVKKAEKPKRKWNPEEEVQKLTALVDQLQVENRLLKVENSDRKRGFQKVIFQKFKKSLSGGWKVTSTEGTNEYLWFNEMSELDHVLFQVAEKHFYFYTDDELTCQSKVENRMYDSKSHHLSKINTACDGKRYIPYVIDNKMKMTYSDGRTEMYVIEGNGDKLKIVNSAKGVSCTRNYEKINRRKRVIPEEEKIENKIQGDWVQTEPNDPTETVCFDYEDGVMTFKFREGDDCEVYSLGLDRRRTIVVYAEDNKLFTSETGEDGEEELEEWSIEDDQLHWRCFEKGEVTDHRIHKRVEDKE